MTHSEVRMVSSLENLLLKRGRMSRFLDPKEPLCRAQLYAASGRVGSRLFLLQGGQSSRDTLGSHPHTWPCTDALRACLSGQRGVFAQSRSISTYVLSHYMCNTFLGQGGCLTLVPIVSPLGHCLCAVSLWLLDGLHDCRASAPPTALALLYGFWLMPTQLYKHELRFLFTLISVY